MKYLIFVFLFVVACAEPSDNTPKYYEVTCLHEESAVLTDTIKAGHVKRYYGEIQFRDAPYSAVHASYPETCSYKRLEGNYR